MKLDKKTFNYLSLSKAVGVQAIKLYWGMEIYLHSFLTSATDGGKRSASRSSHFTAGEGAPTARDGNNLLEHRVRAEDIIKINLTEIGHIGMDWICVAEDRDKQQAVVNTIMNVWVS